ncbi:MAG TPA: hypothetical protein ENK70_09125 [Methylophaga sp.]|nr:hypothetical protein [Methylophaga sp.]
MFLESDSRNWKIEDRFFNVGTEKETTVNTIYQTIKSFLGNRSRLIYQDARLGDIYKSCLDVSKIKKILSWKAEYIFKNGIEKRVEWFEKH